MYVNIPYMDPIWECGHLKELDLAGHFYAKMKRQNDLLGLMCVCVCFFFLVGSCSNSLVFTKAAPNSESLL